MRAFGQSYGAYFNYEHKIRDVYEKILRALLELCGGSKPVKQLFDSMNDILINRAQFKSLLEDQHVSEADSEQLAVLLNLPDQKDLIFHNQLWEYAKQLELHQELRFL